MLPLAVIVAVVLGVAIAILPGWALARFDDHRKCPVCLHRRMFQIDRLVMYDPDPRRELYHCANCNADYVRHLGRWIPRADWPDQDDQELWEQLLKSDVAMRQKPR